MDRNVQQLEVLNGGSAYGVDTHRVLRNTYWLLALSLVDKQYAEPGTQVALIWGEHPGSGTAPDADLGFVRLRATVQPSPYNEHAREKYRKDF